ncbi:hypothetical protein C2W62_34605 [Candidatus Entotheonella serta]|nr:hypothetical protein C2W62_34605 [Candidatus Entotheonella serta]
MSFQEEPTGYDKTALSDLQGAWQNLRDTVVEQHPFPEWERLLFHIVEGMSWESVRNLDSMKATLLLIHNIATQADVPAEVVEWIDTVWNDLEEVFAAITEGEIR